MLKDIPFVFLIETCILTEVLTKYHLGALWPLNRFCYEPGGQHLCRQGQQAVAGQIQVGEVLDVSGGLRWQRGELVVVQIEKSETGHVHQRVPGKGGEGIPVQTKLLQVEQSPETVRAQGGERVERHPQEFQTGEVDEGFARYPLDGRLLNAQFGRVNRKPDRHKRYLGIIADHTPIKRYRHLLISVHFQITLQKVYI